MTLATNEEHAIDTKILEALLLEGDLANMLPKQRIAYYQQVCKTLDLNPLTKPFQYIKFQGKTVLYATKDCTEQIAQKRGISLEIQEKTHTGDVYIVQVRAIHLPSGRFVDATGAVDLANSKGEAYANKLMTAETKASRRAVLRHAGLGFLDETEVVTIPDAVTVEVNHETGEIKGSKRLPQAQKPAPQRRQEPQPSQRTTHNNQWLWDEFIDAGENMRGDGFEDEVKALLPEELKSQVKQFGWGRELTYQKFAEQQNCNNTVEFFQWVTGKLPVKQGMI